MTPVHLINPKKVEFCRVSAEICAEELVRVLTWWSGYSSLRPGLFNGPIIACSSFRVRDDGTLSVDWYETTYAHYLVRVDSSLSVVPARSIYCSVVLVTTEGRVVVCEMSDTTSAPGRLQLPGGNVEVRPGHDLSIENCLEDACRELEEEIGVILARSELTLWRVKVGGSFNDIGLLFVNREPISEVGVRESFDLHLQALRRTGGTVEISNLKFLQGMEGVSAEKRVDYLVDVLNAIRLGQLGGRQT